MEENRRQIMKKYNTRQRLLIRKQKIENIRKANRGQKLDKSRERTRTKYSEKIKDREQNMENSQRIEEKDMIIHRELQNNRMENREEKIENSGQKIERENVG